MECEKQECGVTSDEIRGGRPDVSVIYPCHNEEEGIGLCVGNAVEALRASGLSGEVVVVDNASSDDSARIAEARGARVVREPRLGYGCAVLRGLAEARGETIVMLDADGTYPAEMILDFVREIRDGGADLVCGNRFGLAAGPGAMPWLNRHIGNPVLSALTRLFFSVPLRDIHCGMRAMRRGILGVMRLQAPGMELATEMIVKAADNNLRVREIPIPYRPRLGTSKLRRFRDGWRHVEYMLVLSPTIFLLWPGLALLLSGCLIQLLLLAGPRDLLFRTWDIHTNVAGLAASLVGATMTGLAFVNIALARLIGLSLRHSPVGRWLAASGERPLRAIGVLAALVGSVVWAMVMTRWVATGFGALSAVPLLTLATSLLVTGLEWLTAAFLVRMIQGHELSRGAP